MRSFYLCPFHWKLRPSGVGLQSLVLENIPQVSAVTAKVAQNHDACMEVSATLLVFKLSYIPRSSTPSVRSFYLCPFHWKLRQSGVSLESPGLEIIPEVPANRAKVAQIHDARKEVSATLSVLKWTGAIFRPRSSTPIVRYFYLCPFYWKLRPSGDNLESPVLENIPKFRQIEPKFLKITMCVRRFPLLS